MGAHRRQGLAGIYHVRLVALGRHDLDELRQAARSRDFQPVPLDVITSIVLENSVRRAETANVLGLIPGRDPEASTSPSISRLSRSVSAIPALPW